MLKVCNLKHVGNFSQGQRLMKSHLWLPWKGFHGGLGFSRDKKHENVLQQAPEQVCSIESRKPEHTFVFEMKDFNLK